MIVRKADVLIIGSGIGGLLTAKLLSDKRKVVLITKGNLDNSNSILAQGGIAAAIDKNDHWKDHYRDTLTAGHDHNEERTTEILVKNATKSIQQLMELGVRFDRDTSEQLELGREGGHHHHRIVHAGGDETGRRVITQLIEHVKANVTIYSQEMALDLIIHDGRCIGTVTKDNQGNIYHYQADHTILATGGIGGLYNITSNDKTVTGDGIAMAYRAGAALVDLEFIQFHPTMLSSRGKVYGLISEAVRGEGARLIDNDHQPIMEKIHPLKDLAPRDIVARQIYYALAKGKQIYLDISMIKHFERRFPTIHGMCQKSGISMQKGKLPVAPGAHFIMGGVKTNLNGETTIPGLYAVGETAWTGVHGANRLASNSLLEGIVFANRIADHIIKQTKQKSISYSSDFIEPKLSLPPRAEIQKMMTKYVGIIRDQAGLLHAKEWFEQYLPSLKTKRWIHLPLDEMTKLNMLTVAWLITTSALYRTESRGGHYRKDYPTSEDHWRKRYITRRRKVDESNQTKEPAPTVVY